MIESSNKTIESCEFTAGKVNVFAGIEEDNPSYEIVLSEVESCQARHNDEEDVKHENTVLEEADNGMLLLKNLLEEY